MGSSHASLQPGISVGSMRRLSLKYLQAFGLGLILGTGVGRADTGSIRPSSYSASALAGDGEDLVIASGTSIAAASWPPSDVLSSPVVSTATADISPTYQKISSIVTIANSGPIPLGNASAFGSLSYWIDLLPTPEYYDLVFPPPSIDVTMSGMYTPSFSTATSSVSVSLDVADVYGNPIYELFPGDEYYEVTLDLSVSTMFEMSMSASATMSDTNGSLTASIDPFFQIDPEYAGLVQLVFSPGIGNGISSVPESSTWALVIFGFVGVGCAGFGRRRVTAR